MIKSKPNKPQTLKFILTKDTTLLIKNKIQISSGYISRSELDNSDTIWCIYHFSSCDYRYSEELILTKDSGTNNYQITFTGNINDSKIQRLKMTNEIINDIIKVEDELKDDNGYPLSTTTENISIFTSNKKFEAHTAREIKNYLKLKNKIINNGS